MLDGLIFIHKLSEIVRVLHNTARNVLISISNDIKWKEKNQVFPEDFFQGIVWEVNGFGMIENAAVVCEMKVYRREYCPGSAGQIKNERLGKRDVKFSIYAGDIFQSDSGVVFKHSDMHGRITGTLAFCMVMYVCDAEV